MSTSQFHLAIVRRCCQICGEYQRSGPRNRTISESELRKVFPNLTAKGADKRLSRLTCPACCIKIVKFRKDSRTNLLASQTGRDEEKLAIVAATR